MQVSVRHGWLAGHRRRASLRHRDRGGPDRGSGAHRRLRGDPGADALAPQRFRSLPEERPPEQAFCEALAARGYQEAITFAFVDPACRRSCFPDAGAGAREPDRERPVGHARVAVAGPAARRARESAPPAGPHPPVRARRALRQSSGGATREIDSLAGVALGPRLPEQWGLPKDMRAPVDFFDVKGDVEALLAATGERRVVQFRGRRPLSCLHPGRAARVLRARAGRWAGSGSCIRPWCRELDFTYAPVLFELDLEAALWRSQRSRVPGDLALPAGAARPRGGGRRER